MKNGNDNHETEDLQEEPKRIENFDEDIWAEELTRDNLSQDEIPYGYTHQRQRYA